MATTATLITLLPKTFPYIGIGIAAAQLPTSLPSAEVHFTAVADAITVAAAGEDQSLFVTCDLPGSFVYAMVEGYMRIESVDGDNWDSECISNILNSSSSPTILTPLLWFSPGIGHNTSLSSTKTYRLEEPPTQLIIPAINLDARLEVRCANITIDGAAGTLRFFARFLRYDRNQAQHWQVNTPVLIR